MIEKRWWQKFLLFLTLFCMVGVIYALSLVGSNQLSPISHQVAGESRIVSDDQLIAGGALSELVEVAVPVLAPPATRNEAFDRYRVVRLQGRSRQMETMQNILDHDSLAPSERAMVADSLYRLVELSEKERAVEGLLVATGMQDALVFLSEQAAEVIVPNIISIEDAQRVGELLTRIANVALDRITIIDGAQSPSP